MSTFEGRVKEMPGVSVDRFDNENLLSRAYFLTHLHADHVRGLDSLFFRSLRERGLYLYCTRLTAVFLQKRYGSRDGSASNVKALKACSPTVVEYAYNGERENITVTCVPAGHCPGSAMFLFQRKSVRVLCTGDFRIAPDDFPKLTALNARRGVKVVPLTFDNIYLDTTFLNPDYSHFPTRRETLEEICRAAGDWLARDESNVVSVECPALYGSEFVFMELSEKLGERIHVKAKQFQDYSDIVELSAAVTDDPRSTRVHACVSKIFSQDSLACRTDVGRNNVLTIVISAQRWKKRCPSGKISEWDERANNRLYVCGAMHPSYTEIKAFLEYFRPRRVHPCVDPPFDCKVGAKDLLNELRKEESPRCDAEIVDYDLRSLIGRRSKRPKNQSDLFSDDSSN